MDARARIGVALSAAAVAAIGAVGVWLGLAATSVPTVDVGETVLDEVTVWSNAPEADVWVEWRLRRDETVIITVRLGIGPDGVPTGSGEATAALELLCDTRLRDPVVADGVTVREGGSDEGCNAGHLPVTEDDPPVPAWQTFTFPIDTTFTQIMGHPVRAWTATLGGQRTARSPTLALGSSGGGYTGEAPAFEATDPAPGARLTAVLEASPDELIDVMVTPSGDGVVQETSVTVQAAPGADRWTDSVSWSRPPHPEFGAFLPGGLARWSDPGAQSLMQLLLLLSGALIGVAASLAVERFVAWTMQMRTRRDVASVPAAPAD